MVEQNQTVDQKESKWASRKWRLTLLVLVTTVVLAMIGKMTGDVSAVLTGLIVSYNGSNALIHYAREKAKGDT